MKALTNILTRLLLMLLMLFIVACTEETAEVENLSRGEQYVTVRMNIPGMTATATRAEEETKEDNITSITALAYDSDDKLTKIVSATNLDTEKQTFDIIVPNGTETIHFFANNTVALPEVGTNVSALTSLTTGDYINLCYWGMTTTSDGNTNPLNVTLYRNMAKISIKPSITDTEFNQFEQEDLIISGLIQPNRSGTLVPYNNGFYSNENGDAPNFLTLPGGNLKPTAEDVTPEGNNGAGYGYSLYVLEHDNPKDWEEGLYVICKIGGYYYKVALADDNGEPYDIIRNHEYIIYVSDVDDYSHDNENYRADYYYQVSDKKPINLDVAEVVPQDVTFSPTETQTIQLSNTFTVTMTVPEGGTLTDFSITAEGFTFDQPASSYSTGTYTFTFTPTGVGSKTITFTGTGSENLNNVNTTIDVNVTASITANATTSTTLYYDSDEEQTVTVQVTVPAGVETLNIGGAENFTIAKTAGDGTLNGTTYTMGSERTATFTFTLNAQNVTNQQVFTFSGDNVTADSVIINMVQTPTVAFSNTGNQTLYWNNGNPTNFQVQMTGNNVPNDKTITLTITASDFTVSAANGIQLTQNGSEWTYTGTLTTLTFTPTSSGAGKTINIIGGGVDVNVNSANIAVDVDETLLAVTQTASINLDNSETSTTLTLTKPGNITNLRVTASNNNAFTINGNQINGDYYISGLSSSNETINYTIALRDGFNTAGEYTITFADNGGGGQSVTATITIVNTPSLQFEYDNSETLYLDSSPQLPVTITVPEGSSLTQLNITATGFTVTASSGTLSGSEGSYTYTGGSTTFTFVPTTTDATTIEFTGSGTNLKEISETISVKVVNEKPAQGEEYVFDLDNLPFEAGSNQQDFVLLNYNQLEGCLESHRSKFIPGATLKVKYITTNDQYNTPTMNLLTGWSTDLKETLSESDGYSYLSYTFEDADFENQGINQAGLKLVISYVTIYQISIIPASTTE